MTRPVTLTEALTRLKELEVQHEILTQSRSAQLSLVQKCIKDGESTGDRIEDFMICCMAGGRDPRAQPVREKLRTLTAQVTEARGQLVVILSISRKQLSPGGCFSSSIFDTAFTMQIGQLREDATGLEFRLREEEWAFPTLSHVTWMTGTDASEPLPVVPEPLKLAPGDVLTFYGVHMPAFDSQRRKSVEVLVGDAAIDARFKRLTSSKGLIRMIQALSYPLERFEQTRRLANITRAHI